MIDFINAINANSKMSWHSYVLEHTTLFLTIFMSFKEILFKPWNKGDRRLPEKYQIGTIKS